MPTQMAKMSQKMTKKSKAPPWKWFLSENDAPWELIQMGKIGQKSTKKRKPPSWEPFLSGNEPSLKSTQIGKIGQKSGNCTPITEIGQKSVYTSPLQGKIVFFRRFLVYLYEAHWAGSVGFQPTVPEITRLSCNLYRSALEATFELGLAGIRPLWE